MRVCLGGTFDPFHVGHEALLSEACRDATGVFVGVTDGDLAKRADRDVAPWEERADAVARFIAGLGFHGDLEVNRLTDPVGPAAAKEYDAIVVSPETVKGGHAINDRRKGAGLQPLTFRHVPHVLADDLLPVSSTRVAAGVIDRDGRRLKPVRVVVGSINPVKVEGTERALQRVMPGLDLDVRGVEVDAGVPEQPLNEQTAQGVHRRAEAAMAAVPDADYALGIEAGMFEDPTDGWFDVQGCAVRDGSGHETIGWGPAFQYPDWVTKRATAGETVADILGPVADDADIGGTTGAIGFLTDGRYLRAEFTEQAVMMAFVPRVRRDLYARAPSASDQ